MAQAQDDPELLSRLRDKEARHGAFTDMVEAYGKRLYMHIRRMLVTHEDTEDVLQETLVSAYRGLDGMRGDSCLYTWLYTIATNECMKWFRRNRNAASTHEEFTEIMVRKLTCEQEESEDEMLVRFKAAIMRLPEKQQAVFNMRYYDELSYTDIASITGQSVGTLKVNYHYAVKRIKEELSIDP